MAVHLVVLVGYLDEVVAFLGEERLNLEIRWKQRFQYVVLVGEIFFTHVGVGYPQSTPDRLTFKQINL